MKNLVVLIFSLISFKGICDTIDYWHVYLNNKVIAELNEFSNDKTIKLKKEDLKSSDIITVRYTSCVHYINCTQELSVFAEVMRKLPTARTRERSGELSVSLKDLLEIRTKNNIRKFGFNYELINDGDENKMRRKDVRMLFTLVIE